MATLSDTILTNLRLAGQRAYQSGLLAAAAAGDKLGAANTRVEQTAERMGGQLNQSVFNMGNMLQMAGRLTMALGALATAGAYVGLKFEGSMEQSQVAFTELLNSGSKANLMLQDLFELAARTPFEFPQLVESSQKLLGFGMAAEEVIPLMSKVGDAVAAVGADPEKIDRITRALGQMQAKGKVYSEELLQLADAGLPAYQMLAQGLGVTGEKLNGMLRKGQVDAKTGLDILAGQMEKRYSGMAAKQAKTFFGLLSTIRDYSRMILGFAVRPLFDYLSKKVLPQIVKVETSIVKWGRSGGFKRFQRNLKEGFAEGSGKKKRALVTPDKQSGIAVKAGKMLGKVFKSLKDYGKDLMDALAPMKPFWDNILGPFLKGVVFGAFSGIVGIFKLAIPVIKFVATGLGWLGKKLEFLKPVFYWLGYAIGFIFGPGKIFGVMTKAFGIIGKVIGLVIKPFKWLISLFKFQIGLYSKVASAVLNKLAPMGSKMEDIALKVLEKWDKFKKFFEGFAKWVEKYIVPIANAFFNMGEAIGRKFTEGIVNSKGGKLLFTPWARAALNKLFGVNEGKGGGSSPSISPPPGGGYGGPGPYSYSPDPATTPRPAGYKVNKLPDVTVNSTLNVDGKPMAKNVAKHAQDKAARR